MNNYKQIISVITVGLIGLLGSAVTLLAQPTYTNAGNITVQQNMVTSQTVITAWASNINAVDPQFNISSLSLSGSLQFNTIPAIDAASGDLTFTLQQNTSGFATFNVVLEDLSDNLTSGVSTIRLDVEFINGSPTFSVASTNLTYDEKAGFVTLNGWATSISPGPNPLEQSSQQIDFVTEIVSQSTYIDFQAFPKVDKFGNFSFEATDKSNGTVQLRIYLQDDGADSPPPNSNKSDPIDVTLIINPINDAPTFVKGENIIIDEHNGPTTISSWATQISAGAPDEDESQQLTFVLTEQEVSGNIQFDVPPTIDVNGNISFEVTPHYNGFIIYELVLQDDGINTPFPNENTSNVQAFTITVNFINDPPTFDPGGDVEVEEGDVVTVIENWATNVSPGISPNEQDQEILFTVNFVDVTGSLAFLLAPQIDANGNLNFRTTEHTHGEANFNVFLSDDGDAVLPNENTSGVETLKIIVSPVNFPPDDIRLTQQFVVEKQPPGKEVGQFETSDLDPEDTHNYALVAGEGSEGNDFFAIDGSTLVTNVSFNWEEGDSYSIRVKSSDGEFSIEENFTIDILKLIEGIKFANAITPNADGQNDTWEIEDIDAFPDALVHIYNKAGLTVFKSSGGYTAWDGSTNGKQLPMGTYYYIIDLRDGSPIYQGTLTIIL
jgi:gliding motility-associated-like protein